MCVRCTGDWAVCVRVCVRAQGGVCPTEGFVWALIRERLAASGPPCLCVFLSPGAYASGVCMCCLCRCHGTDPPLLKSGAGVRGAIYTRCSSSPALGWKRWGRRGGLWAEMPSQTMGMDNFQPGTRPSPIPSAPSPPARRSRSRREVWGGRVRVSIWGGSAPRGGGQCGDTLCSQM